MRSMRLIGARCFLGLVVLAGGGVLLKAAAETKNEGRDLHTGSQGQDAQTQAKERLETQADVALAQGRYVTAIDKYQQLDLTQARILNKLGVAYERLGGMQKARQDFEGAIRLDPKLSAAYNNLATVYYAEHNDKKAEQFYKKSIKLDPKNASAFKNLGTSYFVRRKYRKGAEAYEEAIRLDPDTFTHDGINVAPFDPSLLAEMNFYLAELCAKNGQMQAALTYLKKAVAQGFHDQRRLDNDTALASVRQMPEFDPRIK